IKADEVPAEIERLQEAVAAAQAEIEELKRRSGLPDDVAAIFGAHDMLLADSALRGEIEKRIKERLVPAQNAVAQVFDAFVEKFKRLPEHYFSQRAADLR